MSRTTQGLLAGLVLGMAAVFGGWWGFVVTLTLGLVGLAVGAHFDGVIDLGRLGEGVRRRRG
jgi:hypothetical protein